MAFLHFLVRLTAKAKWDLSRAHQLTPCLDGNEKDSEGKNPVLSPAVAAKNKDPLSLTI